MTDTSAPSVVRLESVKGSIPQTTLRIPTPAGATPPPPSSKPK